MVSALGSVGLPSVPAVELAAGPAPGLASRPAPAATPLSGEPAAYVLARSAEQSPAAAQMPVSGGPAGRSRSAELPTPVALTPVSGDPVAAVPSGSAGVSPAVAAGQQRLTEPGQGDTSVPMAAGAGTVPVEAPALEPMDVPGGSADPTAFHASEVVALAQLVLSRNFHGPVRYATAQELLYQARMALGKGDSSLASDLANLAARMLAPQGHDGTGRSLAGRSEELLAEAMAGGGLPAGAPSAPTAASGIRGAPVPAMSASTPPPPIPAAPLQGLAPLTARERGVVLQAAPIRPRSVAPRLATDGTPRGIPRT